jgi:hypothetical protein
MTGAGGPASHLDRRLERPKSAASARNSLLSPMVHNARATRPKPVVRIGNHVDMRPVSVDFGQGEAHRIPLPK